MIDLLYEHVHGTYSAAPLSNYGAVVCLKGKLGKIVIDHKVIDQHFESMSHKTIAVCD